MTNRNTRDTSADDYSPLAIHRLTKCEREVIAFLGRGLSRGEIAKNLYRSTKTIDNHCTRIYSKLGVRSQAQLVNRMHLESVLIDGGNPDAAGAVPSQTLPNTVLSRSLARIESRLLSEQSDRFYSAFLLALCEELRTDFAGICEADQEACEFIAIAVVADGKSVPQMISPFAGCPCTDALRQGQLVCPRGVRQQFPKDMVFEEHAIESYIGVCLDHRLLGQLGTLWVASRTPIENESEVLALLKATRRRIATELALLNAIERLDALPEPLELPPI